MNETSWAGRCPMSSFGAIVGCVSGEARWQCANSSGSPPPRCAPSLVSCPSRSPGREALVTCWLCPPLVSYSGISILRARVPVTVLVQAVSPLRLMDPRVRQGPLLLFGQHQSYAAFCMSRLDMRAAAIVGRERNVAILRGAPRILPGAPGRNWRFKTGELRGSVQTIFDSKTLPTVKRRQAWQDAICQIYLQVDCAAEQQDD